MRSPKLLWVWLVRCSVIDHALPDLTFPNLIYGTHQVPWDLCILLYSGGAEVKRDKIAERIKVGHLGRPHMERLPLVEKIHEGVTTKINLGASHDSISTLLTGLWRFYEWADKSNVSLTLEGAIESYKIWTEALLHRVRIVKDLKHETAYKSARRIGDLLARALGHQSKNPGIALLRLTRVRRSHSSKRALGTQADKQHLAETFEFGHFLANLCAALDAFVVSGPLPVNLSLGEDRYLLIAGAIHKPDLDAASIKDSSRRKAALTRRAPLAEGASAADDFRRSRLINLRIEAELQIFIAQSGMNLSQAVNLRREHYRWQTDGEDLQAFRVYKGRRGGEAIFRCFKVYRSHLERYMTWLEAIGFNTTEGRLFPFVYHHGKIPSAHALPGFKTSRDTCRQLGIRYISSRKLRKLRINWLLRRSHDLDLTAEQMAHSKQTLLRNYAEPHHQSAAAEIIRYHTATDPSYSPPGPGICAKTSGNPSPVPDFPAEAPLPDCISPEGCLFCIYHRDVMSADYCWKLASHARIKALEVDFNKPSKKKSIHPGNRVVDRIRSKLRAIAEGSEVRSQWVRDAEDAVRSGRYHPAWDGQILLMELFA